MLLMLLTMFKKMDTEEKKRKLAKCVNTKIINQNKNK